MAIDALARGMAAAAGGGGGGLDVGIDAGTGIRFTGTDPITIINTGVTAVTTPGDNDIAEDGTIKVANPGAENSADRVHYVKVKGINNAAFKDVDTVINDTKATSTNVPTTKAVYDELEKKLEADLDTTAFTNDNDHVPSSKLVKEKLDDKLEDSLTINGVSYNSNTDSYTLDGGDIDLTGYTAISSGTEEDVAATDSVNDGIAKVEYKADNRIPTANIDTDFPVTPDATHVLASTVASAEFKGTGTAGVNPKKGLVPAPGTISGTETRFLKADGTWATPPNAEYSAGTGINISNTGVITNTGVTDVSASNVADPSIANGTFKVVENGTEKYIPIKGLDDAAYKDVDNAITSGSTSTNLPTTQAVADYVDDVVSDIDATDISLTSNYAPASTASLPAASDPVQTAIGKLAKSVDANQNSISLLGADISFTINSSTYELTARLLNSEGGAIGTAKTVDLPLESMVVDADYDDTNKTIVLTLKNGQTTSFSVADLVSGLQSELNANNKLNPAFIDYDASHRAVSDTEKGTWNGKQDVISDLATIRSGAAAGATAVQPSAMQTALSAKQDSLDNTQLAAVNSGITSEGVAQIGINQTNVLLVQNKVGKNLLDPYNTDTNYYDTNRGIVYSNNKNGTWRVSGTSTQDDAYVNLYTFTNQLPFGATVGDVFKVSSNSTKVRVAIVPKTASGYGSTIIGDAAETGTLTITSEMTGMIIRFSVRNTDTVTNEDVIGMICREEAWNLNSDIELYGAPNYDLTRLQAEDRAALAEEIDASAKNLYDFTKSYGFDNCAVDSDGEYTAATGDTRTALNLQATINNGNSVIRHITGSGYVEITANGIYSWIFVMPSGADRLIIGHNGSQRNGRYYQPITGLEAGKTYVLRMNVTQATNASGTFKWKEVMICTLADWNVSQKFVPYAKSNKELTDLTSGLLATAYQPVTPVGNYLSGIEGGYVRVGNLVLINIRCTVSNATPASWTTLLSGLPYTLIQYGQGVSGSPLSNNKGADMAITSVGTITSSTALSTGTLLISGVYICK